MKAINNLSSAVRGLRREIWYAVLGGAMALAVCRLSQWIVSLVGGE